MALLMLAKRLLTSEALMRSACSVSTLVSKAAITTPFFACEQQHKLLLALVPIPQRQLQATAACGIAQRQARAGMEV
jgi:hypothetical protein